MHIFTRLSGISILISIYLIIGGRITPSPPCIRVYGDRYDAYVKEMYQNLNVTSSMIVLLQTYSYEDFIRGYRPLPDQAGTFGLQDSLTVVFLFINQFRQRLYQYQKTNQIAS